MVNSNIPSRLGLHTGLLQESQVAEPFDKTILPRAERNIVAIRQSARHPAAVRQRIAGMPPVAVNVHLDIRHADRQHRIEVFHRPYRVHPVARSAADQKGRRNIPRNGGRRAIARERCRAGINDPHEIGPRRNSRQRIARVAVLLIEIAEQNRRGSRQFGARREAHDADLIRVDVPFLGVSAHHAYGLLRIVHRIGLRVVPVLAQAIPQNHRIDPVVIEEGNEIRALRADVERIVSAPGHQNHRRARIQPAIHRVDFDRWVMDVDDAVDASRHRLAHVVLFGLADPLRLEKRRARRIKRHHDPARHDRLRRIRSVGHRPRLRHRHGCGQRGQWGAGSLCIAGQCCHHCPSQ